MCALPEAFTKRPPLRRTKHLLWCFTPAYEDAKHALFVAELRGNAIAHERLNRNPLGTVASVTCWVAET